MFKSAITITAALSLITLAACSAETDTPKTTQASTQTSIQIVETVTKTTMVDTKVKAVLVYADWCGSCKVLDPKIKSVRATQTFEAVDFTTLDYTDKDKERFWAEVAAMGLDAPIRTALDGKIKTGVMLLIDTDDNAYVGQITKAMSDDEIAQAINDAVTAS